MGGCFRVGSVLASAAESAVVHSCAHSAGLGVSCPEGHHFAWSGVGNVFSRPCMAMYGVCPVLGCRVRALGTLFQGHVFDGGAFLFFFGHFPEILGSAAKGVLGFSKTRGCGVVGRACRILVDGCVVVARYRLVPLSTLGGFAVGVVGGLDACAGDRMAEMADLCLVPHLSHAYVRACFPHGGFESLRAHLGGEEFDSGLSSVRRGDGRLLPCGDLLPAALSSYSRQMALRESVRAGGGGICYNSGKEGV